MTIQKGPMVWAGLSTDWVTENPVVPAGVLAIETDTGSEKIGNGNTYSALSYVVSRGQDDLGNLLTAGESTISRLVVANTGVGLGASQQMRVGYFTAQKTEQISQLKVLTGATAAGATPTLARMGIYQIAANGDATLIASTPNDTTLFAASSTAYAKALSASFLKKAGQRYAFGILVVSAAAVPSFYGTSGGIDYSIAPRLSGLLPGQADLPASYADASLTANGTTHYGVLLP